MLTTLVVTPSVAVLCAGSFLDLTILAWDQIGVPIPVRAGTASYSSSAPAVASVSTGGRLTAVAPGSAVITTTFTRGSVTLTASTNVSVHGALGDYPEVAGVYDLTAVVQTWDDAFGMPAGSRETAVITIRDSSTSHLLSGTYADYRWFYPGDTASTYGPVSSSLSGSVDCLGHVVIALRRASGHDSFWDGRATLDSGKLVGTFSETGDEGIFTAVRRKTQ